MERYSRHFNLPGFTKETQLSLGLKKVVVIGAGGLGSPVLQYLVAAGVGNIDIIDPDIVSLSNLQRQVLFNEEVIGQNKAETAKKVLNKLNSHINIEAIPEKVDEGNIDRLIESNVDLIIDASDNFECRYLVDSHSQKLGIPLVYGAIHRYEGQVCVFNYKDGPSYRDLFPTAPESGTVDNCDINGVLGPVAGMIGCLMATEALKILSGIGKVQSNELIVLQFDDLSMVKMKIPKRNNVKAISKSKNVYHSISSIDLKKAIDEKEHIHLLDVRMEDQYYMQHIEGSTNIPTDQILERLDEIPKDKEVVVICNIGQSSMNVIRYLQNELEYTNLINLAGGLYSYFNGN